MTFIHVVPYGLFLFLFSIVLEVAHIFFVLFIVEVLVPVFCYLCMLRICVRVKLLDLGYAHVEL